MSTPTGRVLLDVNIERKLQDAKWGEQNCPDGTSAKVFKHHADNRRVECDEATARGEKTFQKILAEEVYEAFAEEDPVRLRAELVQVAAVAVSWIEAIDRRGK